VGGQPVLPSTEHEDIYLELNKPVCLRNEHGEPPPYYPYHAHLMCVPYRPRSSSTLFNLVSLTFTIAGLTYPQLRSTRKPQRQHKALSFQNLGPKICYEVRREHSGTHLHGAFLLHLQLLRESYTPTMGLSRRRGAFVDLVLLRTSEYSADCSSHWWSRLAILPVGNAAVKPERLSSYKATSNKKVLSLWFCMDHQTCWCCYAGGSAAIPHLVGES